MKEPSDVQRDDDSSCTHLRWESYTVDDVRMDGIWLEIGYGGKWFIDVPRALLHGYIPKAGDPCSVGLETAEDGTELANGFALGEAQIFPVTQEQLTAAIARFATSLDALDARLAQLAGEEGDEE